MRVEGPIALLGRWTEDGRRLDDLAVADLPIPLFAIRTGGSIVESGPVGRLTRVTFVPEDPYVADATVRASGTIEHLGLRDLMEEWRRIPCGIDAGAPHQWSEADAENRMSLSGASIYAVHLYLPADEGQPGGPIPAWPGMHLAVVE